ncbi:MAG: hypothetical protein EKK41_04175 [Hyphomicrobiales bacterium]|nr:MAG: hypothetical protein EKK41_04175 [Hyphomicrobiales bacterium]
MQKQKRKISYRVKKKQYANRVARACACIALKSAPEEFVAMIEDHILAKLPAPLMRRLTNGDFGRPMREAMKLTVPFFA